MMSWDAIVIGGGLAGSTLAGTLARRGLNVLVLEKERQFRDRVRGENMLPWGVAAARRLGILDDLLKAGGNSTRWMRVYSMGVSGEPRDLPATTPGGEAALNIYHPDLQETLLRRAAATGATVRRGVTAVNVQSGPDRTPEVAYEEDGERHTERARIAVAADGRFSQARSWAGFEKRRDPELLTMAGVLLTDVDVPDDTMHLEFGPGIASFFAPLGGRRARAYVAYPGVAGRRSLSGPAKVGQFIELCQTAGAPGSWFADAKASGPLAEFDAADTWVESPARNGVALIGDAAAATDPSWGCGLSLTLTDVEQLAGALESNSDWNEALGEYARAHDTYYSALHRILNWMTDLMWTPGPEADARRARVLPRMATDPTGFPDPVGAGPFGPSDDNARRLVLGLDLSAV